MTVVFDSQVQSERNSGVTGGRGTECLQNFSQVKFLGKMEKERRKIEKGKVEIENGRGWKEE